MTPGVACPTGGYWIGKHNNPVSVDLYHGGTHYGVLFLVRIAQPPIALGVIDGQSLRDFASSVH
jgi:hypothetical protein